MSDVDPSSKGGDLSFWQVQAAKRLAAEYAQKLNARYIFPPDVLTTVDNMKYAPNRLDLMAALREHYHSKPSVPKDEIDDAVNLACSLLVEATEINEFVETAIASGSCATIEEGLRMRADLDVLGMDDEFAQILATINDDGQRA